MRIDLKEAVEAKAPTRIDLAGGTVDIWPLYLFHPGSMTLNAAIDLWVRVRVEKTGGSGLCVKDLKENRMFRLGSLAGRSPAPSCKLFVEALRTFAPIEGLDVEFHSEAPSGAGLAGSSSLLVAFCGALMKSAKKRISRERFLGLVRDVESRLIRVPAGMQDYYPALWGGVQALRWEAGGVKREPLAIPPAELEKRLLLVYTGVSRHSGTNNWEIFKRHLDGDRDVQRLLQRIVEATQNMYKALKASDFSSAGQAMGEEYKARKKLFPGIATQEIDVLERLVKRSGTGVLKVCGAGGGGCVVVYTEPEKRRLLARRIEDRGFALIPFNIAHKGLSFQKNSTRKKMISEDNA